jgi:1,2-phenylacetyl-CoA epoxidase catalytic subunit
MDYEIQPRPEETREQFLERILKEIITICMDVPGDEDWRKKVGDKARAAVWGPTAWQVV